MAEEQISIVLKANIDNYNKNMSIAASVLKDLQKQSAEFMKINNGVEDSFTKIEFAAKRFGETAGVLEKKLVVVKKAMTDLVVAGQANTKAFKELDNQYRIITNRLENKAMAEAQAYAQTNMTNMSLPKTAKGLDQVGQSVKKSNMQWTNFALVLQDLPYGFRGIQNNLPALLGGIAGVAGPLYLAGSAVIAFFTAVDNGMIKIGNSVKLTTKYSEEAASLYASEIVRLNGLYKAATNVNISMNERILAAKTLKDLYPGLLSQYSQEEITLGKADTAFKKLTTTLWAYAKAKAAQTSLEEIATKQNDLIIKRADLLDEFSKNNINNYSKEADYTSDGIRLMSRYDLELDKRTRLLRENASAYNSLEAAAAKYLKIQEANINAEVKIQNFKEDPSKETEKAAKASRKKLDNAKKEAAKLAAYVAKRLSASGGETKYIAEPALDPSNAAKLFKEKMDYEKKASKERVAFLKEQYQLEVSEAEGSFDKIKVAEENMRMGLDKGFMDGSIKLSEYIDAILELRKKSNETVLAETKAVTAELLKIGIGLMNALGPALDMLLEKGASIGDVLSRAFEDIIKKLIKVAIAAAIAVAIISLLPGGQGKLAKAGGAMKMFGNLVGGGMGLGSQLFANGGIVSGPTMGLMGEYPGAKTNPEVVAPLDKLKSMIGSGGGSGEFVLRGNDLILAIQRSNSSLKLRRG
jgi:hypothetical protein